MDKNGKLDLRTSCFRRGGEGAGGQCGEALLCVCLLAREYEWAVCLGLGVGMRCTFASPALGSRNRWDAAKNVSTLLGVNLQEMELKATHRKDGKKAFVPHVYFPNGPPCAHAHAHAHILLPIPTLSPYLYIAPPQATTAPATNESNSPRPAPCPARNLPAHRLPSHRVLRSAARRHRQPQRRQHRHQRVSRLLRCTRERFEAGRADGWVQVVSLCGTVEGGV